MHILITIEQVLFGAALCSHIYQSTVIVIAQNYCKFGEMQKITGLDSLDGERDFGYFGSQNPLLTRLHSAPTGQEM